MKIAHVANKNIDLTLATNVKFGSIIRLHDTPSYWPRYYRPGSIAKRCFLFTSEYYREEVDDTDDGTTQLQITDLSDGSCIGLKRTELVEIVHAKGEIMKIVTGKCESRVLLKSIREGQTLRFSNCLASKHEQEDIFLRTEVCSSYIPRSPTGRERYPGKIGVVNLRTGALAWADPDRWCEVIDAEVCVSE